MRVTLLGTGGPRPDPNRQGPAVLVEQDSTRLVIDCGRGVCAQLAKAGVALADLDVVMVTHLHFDHVGNLGDVLEMDEWTALGYRLDAGGATVAVPVGNNRRRGSLPPCPI